MNEELTAAAAGLPDLVLRPWREADVPALVEVYRDPVMRTWAVTRIEDEAEGTAWVREKDRQRAEGTHFALAVWERGDGGGDARLVGGVVLKGVAAGKAYAEVGYWTAPHARGRGVAPRAVRRLAEWAFFTFGLSHLELLHQEDNTASCRVADKSGFAYERDLPAAPPAFPRDGHLHVRRR